MSGQLVMDSAVQTPPVEKRVLGRVNGGARGPTMIIMTGIHGNEWTGAKAALQVLETLQADAGSVRGDLVVLAGNLNALRSKMRFVDTDLNRHWTPGTISALKGVTDFSGRPEEDRERSELVEVFAQEIAVARGPVHFVDLHTSSADGAPFVTCGDTLRNRAFCKGFPLPILLGLEEQVDGSLLEYLNNFGFVTMGVEAGQHDAPHVVARHEAVIWIALVKAGMVDRERIPRLGRFRDLLREATHGLPAILEVRHRHPITAEDEFRMEPGFVNFDPIKKGRLLARDRGGPIHASENGRILLPLYQGKGDDGFFIAREISGFWLKLSAVLRKMSLGKLMPYLPGVRRHPQLPEVLVVNLRIARFYPLEIFHLFGYRKLRRMGQAMVVSRRRYDITPPREIQFG